jgi:hypothetical protein
MWKNPGIVNNFPWRKNCGFSTSPDLLPREELPEAVRRVVFCGEKMMDM